MKEKTLDPQLWQVCAGGMVQMAPVGSIVFYFPQGHAEHSSSAVDFASAPRIPPLIPCRVASVTYLADPDTEEVFSRTRLVPLAPHDLEEDADVEVKPAASFGKTLTQSDANNGGGFSVPRYCAETIFPRLDYSGDPPVQTVIARDALGHLWKFRHIYRGTPRRHLLTTGWSSFVSHKKLLAGDLIVFLRPLSGDLCLGIRRANRKVGMPSPHANRVTPESVIQAASLAAAGRPFEVVYHPRASTPQFCVKASCVRAALRVQWCQGMRFKMAFETEDSSRISWFMGTVASVQAADHVSWPNSPWRLLQVTWDEPDLLQNVKRVSPWLVELVSNMPVINLSPFSPSRKKLRLPQHPEFHLDGQFAIPSFSGNPLGASSPLYCRLSDNAGIQGARQSHFGISLSDLHFNNKLHSGLFHPSYPRFDPRKITNRTDSIENVSCVLTMGSPSPNSAKLDNGVKKHQFLLFGQPIQTEQQISRSSSSDNDSQVLPGYNQDKWKNSTSISRRALELQFPLEMLERSDFSQQQGFKATEQFLDTGHCKVFMESEDVGRTLDLSALGSYEELYRMLTNMFGLEKYELLSHVLYRDATGAVRQAGDEPFGDFVKSAKRLTILMDSGSNKIGRAWIRKGENELECSKREVH